MQLYGSPSPKRTTVWGNTRLIQDLDARNCDLPNAGIAQAPMSSSSALHKCRPAPGCLCVAKAGSLKRAAKESRGQQLETTRRYVDKHGKARFVGKPCLKSTQRASQTEVISSTPQPPILLLRFTSASDELGDPPCVAHSWGHGRTYPTGFGEKLCDLAKAIREEPLHLRALRPTTPSVRPSVPVVLTPKRHHLYAVASTMFVSCS